jgi:hypothetical protein
MRSKYGWIVGLLNASTHQVFNLGIDGSHCRVITRDLLSEYVSIAAHHKRAGFPLGWASAPQFRLVSPEV